MENKVVISYKVTEGADIMDEFLKLPVGIDNFEKIRRNGFYYVDKTSLIEQLFSSWGKSIYSPVLAVLEKHSI